MPELPEVETIRRDLQGEVVNRKIKAVEVRNGRTVRRHPSAKAFRAQLEGRSWEPVLAMVARWPERVWTELDGVYVNESPILTFVADDGARRGDGAPVLVAHADPVFSAGHLDDPEAAAPAMLAELVALLGLDALDARSQPEWLQVKRWGVARPAQQRDEPFHLGDARVGLAGDGWHGRPRIEAAYLSGDALGHELVARLR